MKNENPEKLKKPKTQKQNEKQTNKYQSNNEQDPTWCYGLFFLSSPSVTTNRNAGQKIADDAETP
jgi:hypothetical protein